MLRGEGIRRNSDGSYFLSKAKHPGLGGQDGIQRICCFLAFLESHANHFFGEKKARDRSNYEDLYYSVTQLADAVDDYENPAISGLLKDAEHCFVRPPLANNAEFQSEHLFDETRRYIKGVVAHSLSGLQPAPNHLRSVVQAAQDQSFSRVEIFTLNHDLLIERTLERAGISFSNGFVSLSDDLRSWDGAAFARSRARVRLIKMHGSVDWYPMRFSRREPSLVCIPTNGDIEHARGPNDEMPGPLPDRPAILIGTFNKMLEYTMGIYADLFCAFRAALGNLDRVVVSGYSFGDKGVNASLVEWTRQSCERKVLIIAPDASNYRHTARGAIRRLFSDCGVQLTPKDSGFEELTWNEVRKWCRARSRGASS